MPLNTIAGDSGGGDLMSTISHLSADASTFVGPKSSGLIEMSYLDPFENMKGSVPLCCGGEREKASSLVICVYEFFFCRRTCAQNYEGEM